MKLRTRMLTPVSSRLALLLALNLAGGLCCSTKVSGRKPFGYQVGYAIEPDVFVLDKDMQKRSPLSLFDKQAKVVVLDPRRTPERFR
jgi:hypothetical protein